MKVAAIYALVSTKRQEQERTIESQVAQLWYDCINRGWLIPPFN